MVVGAENAELGIPGLHARLELLEAPVVDRAECLHLHRHLGEDHGGAREAPRGESTHHAPAGARLPDDVTAMEALDRVSDAVRDSLSGDPLPRDDFHQALRERLPKELLWWCRGCNSHHVHPSLWRATGIRGVLAIVGREGRSAVFGAPPEAAADEDPGAELARRFLHAYGPARPKLLADWAGIATSHAHALWELAPFRGAETAELVWA
ncbi:MAG: DNA glycosylase AlkZ-like family protein [Thermoleophilaceae bacterium]